MWTRTLMSPLLLRMLTWLLDITNHLLTRLCIKLLDLLSGWLVRVRLLLYHRYGSHLTRTACQHSHRLTIGIPQNLSDLSGSGGSDVDWSHRHLLSTWLHHSEGLWPPSSLLSDYELLSRRSNDHMPGLLTSLLLLLNLRHSHILLTISLA